MRQVTAVWLRSERDVETGKPYRLGFVQMEDEMQMSFAYEALRRKRWRGMSLRVSYAQPHI